MLPVLGSSALFEVEDLLKKVLMSASVGFLLTFLLRAHGELSGCACRESFTCEGAEDDNRVVLRVRGIEMELLRQRFV